MHKKSYYALDVAKFVSAFLVICIHTAPLIDMNVEANFVLVQILSRIAVPLFFVISGFLFFSKIDMTREWNDYANRSYLFHYLGRLLKIYVVWTILYLPFTYLLMQNGDGITVVSIVRYIRDFFFTGSYYHLWFLPALMFAVSAVYLLLSKCSIKSTLFITAIFYGLGMLGNIYPEIVSNIPVLSQVFEWYLKIFVTTRNGLFFGMIFIALGAYFAQKRLVVTCNTGMLKVGFLISFIALVMECLVLKQFGYMHDLASMYLMLIPTVSFLFLVLIHMEVREKGIYKVLRVLSLLIYVSHIMFVVVVCSVFPTMNSLMVYIFAAGGSLLFSILLYVLSQKITILKGLY